MNFRIVPIPTHLQDYVECIRIARYDGEQPLTINVCLNGLPGIVFQHSDGYSPVEKITTTSGMCTDIPIAQIYGQMTEPGIMHHRGQPFTTTQVVLKPHALQTLLGINAALLTNTLIALSEFSGGDLPMQLLEADQTGQAGLIIGFLTRLLEQAGQRDPLIEESLRLIHHQSCTITVKDLLAYLSLSERHFERRFMQTVGLSPQFYIRVKRFNAAVRLMHTGQGGKLADLAYALNFYDQSHFIRDIKAFSGITPKTLIRKVDDFQPQQAVIAYT